MIAGNAPTAPTAAAPIRKSRRLTTRIIIPPTWVLAITVPPRTETLCSPGLSWLLMRGSTISLAGSLPDAYPPRRAFGSMRRRVCGAGELTFLVAMTIRAWIALHIPTALINGEFKPLAILATSRRARSHTTYRNRPGTCRNRPVSEAREASCSRTALPGFRRGSVSVALKPAGRAMLSSKVSRVRSCFALFVTRQASLGERSR